MDKNIEILKELVEAIENESALLTFAASDDMEVAVIKAKNAIAEVEDPDCKTSLDIFALEVKLGLNVAVIGADGYTPDDVGALIADKIQSIIGDAVRDNDLNVDYQMETGRAIYNPPSVSVSFSVVEAS